MVSHGMASTLLGPQIDARGVPGAVDPALSDPGVAMGVAPLAQLLDRIALDEATAPDPAAGLAHAPSPARPLLIFRHAHACPRMTAIKRAASPLTRRSRAPWARKA